MEVGELVPDFQKGPLDVYRQKASFCWKKLRLAIEDEELLRYKMRIWKAMENDPLFQHSPETPSLDEQRRLATLRMNKVHEYKFLTFEEFMEMPIKLSELIIALSQYDMSLCLKYFVPHVFFTNSIRDLGTEKHTKFLAATEKRQITGCYALTEVAHGTDAKNMRTTATFDPSTQEFVLHSQNFEAGKCWIGSLGKSATHGSVFAQLITPDGTNHGLHAFIVPLRNPKTMLAYPGVIIADMGEKAGLNGVDNGFAAFNHYRIPKDNLLDKMGTVTAEGKYISPYKDPRKRFAASLGTLLLGRVGLVGISAAMLAKATVIAIRYSAIRRQFGSSENNELPIIEYQLQQWRLFPYLAAAYALKIFSQVSTQCLVELTVSMWVESDKQKSADIGLEQHALQSSAKGLSTWTAQQGIQQCREACGGHGYLKCSGFGILRNDNDANCTYEGDNNVLCQQTSNWLLYLWNHRNQPRHVFNSPLGSVTLLYEDHRKKQTRFSAKTLHEVCQIKEILAAYEWLIIWLLEETQKVYKQHERRGKDSFTTRNDSQVFFAHTLSFVYIERSVIQAFCKFYSSENIGNKEKSVLEKLCVLYGLWSLQKYLNYLYEGGYAEGPMPSKLIKEGILHLCLELKPDAVALADALAPPDFILNSAIGKSDGQLYKNLQAAIFQNPGAMERPQWWQEIVTATSKSKL